MMRCSKKIVFSGMARFRGNNKKAGEFFSPALFFSFQTTICNASLTHEDSF